MVHRLPSVSPLRVADPEFNIESTVRLAHRASDLHAAVALFRSSISAYSNEDLFHQDALLRLQDLLSLLVRKSLELSPPL
jgi:NAD+ synthase (glutamine-hydrolysing)